MRLYAFLLGWSEEGYTTIGREHASCAQIFDLISE